MQDKPKQKLEFSPEEWALILSLSSRKASGGGQLHLYASVLGPIVILAAYGGWKSDIAAVGSAFLCLLAYMIWSNVSASRWVGIYQSIFNRIVAFQELQEASPAPGIAFEKRAPSQSQDDSP